MFKAIGWSSRQLQPPVGTGFPEKNSLEARSHLLLEEQCSGVFPAPTVRS